MNILNQTYYTAKRFLMDVKSIVIMTLAYIIIILILGSAFKGEFTSSDLDKVTVLYLDEDKGVQGETFIEQLTNMDGIKELIKFEKAESMEYAEKKIKDEKAEALIYLSEEFSEQVLNQDESNLVKVYRSKYSSMNALIVRSVMESYINGLNTAGVVYKTTGSLKDFSFDTEAGIEKQPLTAKGKVPDAMGYYTIAMLIMMLFYGADNGNLGIGEDYHGTIGDRMQLSQIKPYQQYSGKVLGIAIVEFVQAIIIILFTKIFYKVDWGIHIGLLIFIVLSFIILTVTFGGMVSIITGNNQKASTVISAAVIACTFLAGGFVAMDFGMAKYFSLNYYAQSSITNVVYQGSMSVVYRNLMVMWAISAVFVFISVAAARRKKL